MKDFEIEKLPEFDNHRLVTYVYDPQSDLRGFIAIHRDGQDRPAFGATRLWNYNSETDCLRDALRLSRAMSYKAALAGVDYGGGKGAIIYKGSSAAEKRALLRWYAEKLNFLGGRFITGTDVGLTMADLRYLHRRSPYLTGLRGDASKFTAAGVFYAVKVCLKELFGDESITQRTFAIQGLGKIGGDLLKIIYPRAKQVYVADIDKNKIRDMKKRYPKIKVVKVEDIHQTEVDVFSPCALSGAINHKNISQLRCQAIVGGANNQLDNATTGELLYKLGILYAPDYVVNAGGLICVVDEYERHDHDPERVLSRLGSIETTLSEIIEISKKKNKATNLIADEMAIEIVKQKFGK